MSRYQSRIRTANRRIANSVLGFIIGTLIIGAAVLGLSGCGGKAPQSVHATTNQGINVEFLFEHEGCRVYRFEPGGHYVYYTNCGDTSTTESYQCGKTRCTREVEVKGRNK